MSAGAVAPEMEKDAVEQAQGAPTKRRRWWRRAQVGLAIGVLGAAAWFMAAQFRTLEAAAQRLSRLDLRWVAVAVGAEASSMVAFAGLQRRLLRAAGSSVPLSAMTGLTLASNSIDATFPGGVAWAAAWLFSRLGRFGVDRFQRVWVFLVAGGVSSFALFLVVGSGVELAGSQGPVASLRWLVLLLALIPAVAVVLEAYRSSRFVSWLAGAVTKVVRDDVPGGRRLASLVARTFRRFTAVELRPLGWLEVLALGLANWLLDCLVLVACLEALHVSVPWRALLVIYGLTQISAAFPITPGGIGVVAGSLGALLHAYGLSGVEALSVVILYRILTFYVLVPLGWAVFGALELRSRYHRSEVPAAQEGAAVAIDTETCEPRSSRSVVPAPPSG